MANNYDREVLEALNSILVNMRINDYALERVAFGYEKPGSMAPIDLYLQHLELNHVPSRRSATYGAYINEDERLNSEKDYSEYVRDLFVTQMESIFIDAPQDSRLVHELEEIPLIPRFRDYLFGLLPLFTEIMSVKVEYDVFDVIPIDKKIYATEYPMWHKFVTAILLNPLRTGSRINKYVNDIKNAPYYISRLIEKRGNNFYLKTADVESTEYKFALFSLMQFINCENDRLLELKMQQWERFNKKQ